MSALTIEIIFCTIISMLNILTFPDELLTKKAALVTNIDRKISDFTNAMLKTMYKGRGIGLAAPQVGDLKAVFVCHAQDDIPRVFINPEITGTSNKQVSYEEGCLSIPGIYADILRAEEITVQAWDEKGKPFTIDAEGILARIIIHEMDHLKGMLFIDRVNEKKRQRLINTYNKILKM